MPQQKARRVAELRRHFPGVLVTRQQVRGGSVPQHILRPRLEPKVPRQPGQITAQADIRQRVGGIFLGSSGVRCSNAQRIGRPNREVAGIDSRLRVRVNPPTLNLEP